MAAWRETEQFLPAVTGKHQADDQAQNAVNLIHITIEGIHGGRACRNGQSGSSKEREISVLTQSNAIPAAAQNRIKLVCGCELDAQAGFIGIGAEDFTRIRKVPTIGFAITARHLVRSN